MTNMAESGTDSFAAIANATASIHPSLLNCDFGILRDEIASAESAGAHAVHWDVMDGRFVPNFTYGPPVIASLRKSSKLFFDTHLMMIEPQDHIDAFIDAGCDNITFHIEAVPNPGSLLGKIRGRGVKASLAINPGTPVDAIKPWLDQIDMALVMTVQPGHGGQSFRPECMAKVAQLRQLLGQKTPIQVDGGINAKTAAIAAKEGARWFVVGSAFYNAADRPAAFKEIHQAAQLASCWQG